VLKRAVLKKLESLTMDRLVLVSGDARREYGPGGGLAATVTVKDERFFRRVALGGSLGAADAYVEGLWSTDDLVTALRILLRNLPALRGLDRGGARLLSPFRRFAHWLNRNTRTGSRKNIAAHYDLGNDLFRLFLDETMAYSAAVFPRPEATLEEGQEEKFDRLCRGLALAPEHRLVEIGTGWGGFAVHAAGRYGCRVVTTTISKEQHDLAVERIRAAGLADRVEVLLRDYRDLAGRFDRLVSIEMIEAVGHGFLPAYLGKCADLLVPDGLAAIQAILMREQDYRRYLASVDFIRARIFPGSTLPALHTIASAVASATDFRIVHLEDITPHYARTLALWRERFMARVAEVRALGYPEEFVRLWEYYLAFCEAGFTERYIADQQIYLAKPGWRGEVSP
jgi:cyclopropane-fatty-acyl-phospholipid synthase